MSQLIFKFPFKTTYYEKDFFVSSNNFEDRLFGLDAKLRLSSSSYIDLTINPDFGQIEMDPEFINLSYYEIYLPEKRAFFNESWSLALDTPIEEPKFAGLTKTIGPSSLNNS